METAIIIVLAFMLLIAIIILIDIRFDTKRLNIKIRVLNSSLDKSNNQNKYLRSKNADLKKIIEEQDYKLKEYKKYSMDSRDSKITELETKYQSALKKIVERDEKIRLLDSEIFKYDKCNKQIAEELVKKNNVIEDAWNTIRELEKTKKQYSARVYELHGEKDFAIHQSKSAIKLCDQMSKMFKLMNSELESIESELLGKLKL